MSPYLLHGLILAQIGRLAVDGMIMERGRDWFLEAYADIIFTACGRLHTCTWSIVLGLIVRLRWWDGFFLLLLGLKLGLAGGDLESRESEFGSLAWIVDLSATSACYPGMFNFPVVQWQ